MKIVLIVLSPGAIYSRCAHAISVLEDQRDIVDNQYHKVSNQVLLSVSTEISMLVEMEQKSSPGGIQTGCPW